MTLANLALREIFIAEWGKCSFMVLTYKKSEFIQ